MIVKKCCIIKLKTERQVQVLNAHKRISIATSSHLNTKMYVPVGEIIILR